MAAVISNISDGAYQSSSMRRPSESSFTAPYDTYYAPSIAESTRPIIHRPDFSKTYRQARPTRTRTFPPHRPLPASNDVFTVAIPTTVLSGQHTSESEFLSSRRSSLTRLFQSDLHEYKMVRMTRAEYESYWAKDGQGNYVGTEPEGSGAERLRRALEGMKGVKRSVIGNRN